MCWWKHQTTQSITWPWVKTNSPPNYWIPNQPVDIHWQLVNFLNWIGWCGTYTTLLNGSCLLFKFPCYLMIMVLGCRVRSLFYSHLGFIESCVRHLHFLVKIFNGVNWSKGWSAQKFFRTFSLGPIFSSGTPQQPHGASTHTVSWWFWMAWDHPGSLLWPS